MGVTLGNHAFDGNAKLTSLTFGSDAKIGDFAFFNAAALKNVDLSRAKSIGANAFSGSVETGYRNNTNEYRECCAARL